MEGVRLGRWVIAGFGEIFSRLSCVCGGGRIGEFRTKVSERGFCFRV